jgi:hypothetical protein
VRAKLRAYAALPAIVALGALVLGAAPAAADGKDKRKLRLVATESQFEFLDLGAPGPSLGDEFVFSEVLSRRGRDVGTSGGVCTATEVMPPYDVITFHCVATLSLTRRGQITLQGLVEIQGEEDPGPFTVAITGGTGDFRSACGEAKIRDVSETRSVYKLRFDNCINKDRRDKKKHRRKRRHDR